MSVLEIAAGHWPFSDQISTFGQPKIHLGWPNLLYIFNGTLINSLQKCSIFENMADQFLNLIFTTVCEMLH